MEFRTGDAETLLWCMRPALHLAHLRGPLPESIASLPPAERPFRTAQHTRVGGVLAVTETTNQARAIQPVIDADDEAEPVETEVPDAPTRERLFDGYVFRSARMRVRQALAGRVDDGVVDSLENQLYKVATALHMYRSLDLAEHAAVLVSTQHSPILRALIAAAEEQARPVVYVPHAPVAANPAYLDLPVARAGLRGAGEVEFYERALGIDPASLDVVGNLASDILSAPIPPIEHDGAGVLALSPHSPETVRAIFEAVGAHGLGAMTVAPHPRSDLEVVRSIMPADWSLYEGGRTLDLLSSGPPFVLQFSSGVAWESAALGIPTATVRLSDDEVNYPFLADETVYPSIRTPDDAARFAARARAGEYSSAALRTHAERWCGVDGDRAATLLSELLDREARDEPQSARPRLHDGWARGGRALAASWIASTAAAPA